MEDSYLKKVHSLLDSGVSAKHSESNKNGSTLSLPPRRATSILHKKTTIHNSKSELDAMLLLLSDFYKNPQKKGVA